MQKEYLTKSNSFSHKNTQKLETEGNVLSITADSCEKLPANITFNGERLKNFPNTVYIYLLSRVLDKKIKGIQTLKEEVKLSLFRKGMVFYK